MKTFDKTIKAAIIKLTKEKEKIKTNEERREI